MEPALNEAAFDSYALSPDLHFVSIWLAAMKMPLRYLPELIKFGAIPLALAWLTQGVGALLLETGIARVAVFWRVLTMVVIFVPFEVGWTRLTINGPASVVTRSYFGIGKTEGWYLLATILFGLSWAAGMLPLLAFTTGARNFDQHLMVEGGILFIGLWVALLICEVRLLFVFPALATETFAGLGNVWRSSKGHFEQILVLDVIARLPYFIAIEPLARLEAPDSTIFLRLLLVGLETTLALFSIASGVAAIALAYRTQFPDEKMKAIN